MTTDPEKRKKELQKAYEFWLSQATMQPWELADAYAAECVRAERDRCARIAKRMIEHPRDRENVIIAISKGD